MNLTWTTHLPQSNMELEINGYFPVTLDNL